MTREPSPQELEALDREITAARKRLGSPEDTRRWLLDLPYRDLKTLSASERATLNYELLVAGGTTEAKGNWGRVIDIQQMPLNALAKVQTYIRISTPVLLGEAGGRTIGGIKWWGIKRVSAPDADELRCELTFFVPSAYAYIVGGFLGAVLRGGRLLRICKQCNKAYVANTKRMEYCGLNCSQAFRNDKKKAIREARKKSMKK